MFSFTKSRNTNLLTPEKPMLPITREPTKPAAAATLHDEYRAMAGAVGFSHPHIAADLSIENFKAFLRLKDWAVFDLATVISYMDKKADEESAKKAGWHWRPLRQKDHIDGARFGTAARVISLGGGSFDTTPASDHYEGEHTEQKRIWNKQTQDHEFSPVSVPPSALPYDKLVPIHALRKVAVIEKEYQNRVAFFVCDYAPAPHIEYADPFLMAVIDNARLVNGHGRFVIDFWDEPGFGLEQQLA